MGRVRVPNKPDPVARAGIDVAGPLLRASVRRIQHSVLRRHYTLHADIVCRLPAGAELRTYAGELTFHFFYSVRVQELAGVPEARRPARFETHR